MTPQQINARVKVTKAIDYLTRAKQALPNKDEQVAKEISEIISKLFDKYK